jgi:hypothetical protein
MACWGSISGGGGVKVSFNDIASSDFSINSLMAHVRYQAASQMAVIVYRCLGTY